MMVDAIKSSAKKYDYDYGFEDYIDEGIDEYGPYARTILVPRNLYDKDGNDISKSSFLPYVARMVFASVLSFSSGIFEIFE